MNGDPLVEFHSVSSWHCSFHLKRDHLLEFCVAIVCEDCDNHTCINSLRPSDAYMSQQTNHHWFR